MPEVSRESEPVASKPARLEIRVGEQVHVVLEGDPAFVMEAYGRVQADVVRALTSAAPLEDAEAPPLAPREEESVERLRESGDLLWVYRCEDDLRTVYATRRSRFAATRFAQAYGVGRAERVYVEDERLLRALRKGSRTLWRELEPEGLRRIKEAAEKADKERSRHS